MKRTSPASLLLLAAALGMAIGAPPALAQWSRWRGPEDDGVSRESGLPSKLASSILWRQPLGGGRSTPIIQDGRVVICARAGEGITEHERVICYQAETGKILWEDAINVFHTTIPGPRVGWANPVGDPATGHFYFHGVEGLLKCYDRDGRVVWSRSMTEEFGSISGYGGRTNTPIIVEDMLVLSFLNASWGDQGRGAHRFVAFDKLTGEVRWWVSPGGQPLDTTYSTPVITVINGVLQLVVGCADGVVYGLEARTGRTIWSFRLSKRGLNVSPVVDGNLVYISHSEENIDKAVMGRVVCIDATGNGDVTATHEKWRADEVAAGYSSPAVHEGRVYVVDNSANLFAFDGATGKELWVHNLGTVGKASPVVADGKIYIGEVNGRFHVLGLGDSGCTPLDELHLKRAADGVDNEIFGSCGIANGRVFLSTRDEMLCFGEKTWSGSAGTAPKPPAETPVSQSDPAATAIVVPGDVLLAPGGSAAFRVRLYNDRGQYLRDAESVTWSLAGVKGAISEKGMLAVAAGAGFQAGVVQAKAGDLGASARVRVQAPLPAAIDFDGIEPGKLPSGWIGMSPVKFKIVELDGSRVLQKHGTSQRFARALAFLGTHDLASYTIEADVRGNFTRRAMPDVGLVNQRYRLSLMGGIYDRKSRGMTEQVLRILTWVPQKRLEKDAPFEWKPDTWYRMKFRVEPKGSAALIRGKVWPRGEAEPAAWTVEAEDPFPHREGSFGVYAYTAGTTASSPGTDAYFDNVKVYTNE